MNKLKSEQQISQLLELITDLSVTVYSTIQ
jgi:hypothetical protein